MEAAAPPDFDPADRELKPILHEEIGRLPTRLREAIVLCYLQGLTVDQAARKIGCPLGTLKSRLGKGREILRARLTRRGLAASALLLLLFSLTEEASAEVPESLLDATICAGSHGAGGVGVTRRVASMVLAEEARRRWFRAAGSWGLLAVLILLFGASRMTLGRHAIGAPTMPLAASPASKGMPSESWWSTSRAKAPGQAPGDHCKPFADREGP